MIINLSITALQKLNNTEALLLFAIAICLSENPNATTSDFIRKSTCGSIYNKLEKFEEMGLLEIEHSKCGNRFSYIEPLEKYISIDSSLLDVALTRTEIGSLIRLKCWSRVNTNIVDLSLNRIVHETGISSCSIYKAIEEKLLKRGNKNLYIEFIHPSLTSPA